MTLFCYLQIFGEKSLAPGEKRLVLGYGKCKTDDGINLRVNVARAVILRG